MLTSIASTSDRSTQFELKSEQLCVPVQTVDLMAEQFGPLLILWRVVGDELPASRCCQVRLRYLESNIMAWLNR